MNYLCIYVVYIIYTGIYLNDFHVEVQQWLVMNGKSKNLVVAQSHKTECLSWSSVYIGVQKKWAPKPVKEWILLSRQG